MTPWWSSCRVPRPVCHADDRCRRSRAWYHGPVGGSPPGGPPAFTMRHLVLVLGDQLDRRSAAFDGFDASQDAVWMAEVAGESTHVWSAKPRIVMFLAAMRHFRDRIVAEGLPVDYRALSATPAVDEPRSLATAQPPTPSGRSATRPRRSATSSTAPTPPAASRPRIWPAPAMRIPLCPRRSRRGGRRS